MTFLVIPIKVDEASVKAQKGKQLVHKQFPFSFLLKSLSTLGKMQDKGKQVARTNKYLTKLFSNKVVIHMPQVLSEIGLECNGLETLCIKDQNFSVKRAEKVFGWALSHHLMRNTQADIDLRLVLSSNRIRHSRCLAFSNALPPMGINFYNCLAKVQKLESLSLTDNGSGSGRDKLDIRAQFMVPECLRNHIGFMIIVRIHAYDKESCHAVHYSCAHVILLTISENSDLYQDTLSQAMISRTLLSISPVLFNNLSNLSSPVISVILVLSNLGNLSIPRNLSNFSTVHQSSNLSSISSVKEN
ncbi:hypothetical protein T459_17849 [Capsicum annuum]|uniref:DUF7751 domain-containing protein n=1 Tax=Capsicum annuum TaxID=4072 RepID=A0A2G2ZCP8_CAPAN|nr:hypothetical protein T459_17849 [Capsicum annuum]